MNVGDQRDLDVIPDLAGPLDVLLLGHRHPHDLAAGLLQLLDLGQGRRRVERVRRRHRLNPDRVLATHHVIVDPDLARLVPRGPLSSRPSLGLSYLLYQKTICASSTWQFPTPIMLVPAPPTVKAG